MSESKAWLKANWDRQSAHLAETQRRVNVLEQALGNCRLLAMKRLHKGATEQADWEAILRFCTEAGCGPSPLRAIDQEGTGR